MTVILNGEPRTVADARNMTDLVKELQLLPATLLIEHNGTALHRREWDSCALSDGDRIELIRVVAGG
jgi:thiamine biosynthesis protein ThiS